MDINYRDQIIRIDDDGIFNIEWEESIKAEVRHQGDHFDTLQRAKELIDRRLTTLGKREPLALAAMTGSGIPITITGIHQGTHNALTTPKVDRYGGPIYFDHPDVRAKLTRIQEIEEEALNLKNSLKNCVIQSSFGYGRMQSQEYETKITELKDSYARAGAAALILSK